MSLRKTKSTPRIKRDRDSKAGKDKSPLGEPLETAAGVVSAEPAKGITSKRRKARRKGGFTKKTISLRAAALSEGVGTCKST